jgi:hypothetical protein
MIVFILACVLAVLAYMAQELKRIRVSLSTALAAHEARLQAASSPLPTSPSPHETGGTRRSRNNSWRMPADLEAEAQT